ncbi:hypothetical protein [Mucilaginibacter antarcticus]|uniref:Subunit length determinant protein n=1 Tax=Mucilaginibacter antarcticus TaxID=1855725 RepID=A0ABW5XRH9_9SPHI
MSTENTQYPYEPEFSFKQLIANRFADIRYVLQFKKLIAITLIISAALGAFLAWYKAPTYTARLTFVVDDTKSAGGAGGLSALAGQFGLNMDALSGSNSILAGDNVQELIKSRRLIKATLLTPYDSIQTLADKYAAVNKLSKKWLKYSPDGKTIRFPLKGLNNTRLQDSLLHEMIMRILDGEFAIAKTDKKLGFFEVNTTMRDEKLAQLFCNRMIKESTDFYISTKTKRLRTNIQRLSARGDSIGKILTRKTYNASAASQGILDINPAYTGQNANIEIKERDKILLSSTYTETIKSLEASKTVLAQETPTVQIVDEPELPLKKNSLKYYITIPGAMLLGIIIFGFYALLTRKESKI